MIQAERNSRMIESITSIANSVNAAIGIGRILRDTDKVWDQAEFKIKMSDLIEKLVDAKDHLQSNREENLNLREENLDLKKKLTLRDEVEFDGTKYWGKDKEGKKSGPFCQKCKDVNEKLIRLQPDSNSGGSYWTCFNCGGAYDVPPYAPSHHNRSSGGYGGSLGFV